MTTISFYPFEFRLTEKNIRFQTKTNLMWIRESLLLLKNIFSLHVRDDAVNENRKNALVETVNWSIILCTQETTKHRWRFWNSFWLSENVGLYWAVPNEKDFVALPVLQLSPDLELGASKRFPWRANITAGRTSPPRGANFSNLD